MLFRDKEMRNAQGNIRHINSRLRAYCIFSHTLDSAFWPI